MKSLANSSSFAIVQNPRCRSSPHVSYLQAEICFSLRCRNNQLPNFRSLKLLQINCIAPVRDSLQRSLSSSSTFPVFFGGVEHCRPASSTNEDDALFGSWDPSDAIPMSWPHDHIWTAETDVTAGKTIQYKFILKERKGNVTWQPGSDRFIQAWETVNGMCVFEDWENAELQKITEELQHQHSNEESQQEEKPSNNTDRKDEQSQADRLTQINPNGKVTSIKNQEIEVEDEGQFEF